jgi:hypothetical protein
MYITGSSYTVDFSQTYAWARPSLSDSAAAATLSCIVFRPLQCCPSFPAVRTAKGVLRSQNNVYFLPLIYFCPGNKIMVISAAPGSKILGPYRRVYDKKNHNNELRSIAVR